MVEPFRHRIRVRYSECDAQGVVFNANYLTYMDDAITEMLRATLPGGYRGLLEAGVDQVVGEARVRYLAPVRFEDLLDIELTIARLGTTGVTTDARFVREGETVAEGTLRHVYVHTDGSGKRPIPEDLRTALEPYVVAEPAT